MNAKQIIERYNAGERDFRRLNLRGMNFKGADLSGADFSECDLRGTNFKNAQLDQASFRQCQCGLPIRWLAVLCVVILFPVTLTGIFYGFIAVLVTSIFTGMGDQSSPILIESIVGLSISFIMCFVVWHKGLIVMMSAAALSFVLAVATAFLLAIAGIIVGMEGIPIAIITTLPGILTGIILLIIINTITATIALSGIGLGFISATIVTISTAFGSISVGGTGGGAMVDFTMTLSAAMITVFAYLMSLRIWQGDRRDAWVRSFAVAYGAIGGTCFRGADLTDADFTGARLKSTDFREAKLVRAIFQDTIKLDQVRPGTSYLSIKKIRELLLSGKAHSEDKNYSRLVNLQGLNLAGFDLTNANFSGSDLSNSNLSGANLTDANLITTNLNDADLKDADLPRAKLVQTQLDNADLTGANLTGACIEDWGITVYTVLNGIHADYVYMRFIDGDKRRRKPDGEDTNFAEGEFVEFIKPLIDTLDLYHRQVKDPRTVALALKKLQAEHPEAEIEPISWERRGKNGEDIMIRTRISEKANPSQLHAAHFEEYNRLQALPPSEIQTLMARLEAQEKTISILEGFVDKALAKPSIQHQTVQGDFTMGNKEDRSISVGGNAGIVGGGDVKDINFQGTMNLGEISGNVTNTINQLPDSPDPDKPNIKELLSQLQAAINAENELSNDDKADALEQIRTFAEAAQNPSDSGNQKLAKTASRVLKGILAEMPTFTAAAKQIQEYLPLILTFFGI